MPSKVIVTGIILIVMVAMLVFVVEFFLPLSMKSDMNFLCRNTLLKMEVEGGLLEQERLQLQTGLREKGFDNISVSGTGNIKQGGLLNLCVEADYSYSRLSSLFIRGTVVQHMSYDMTSMSRKVVN
jgi:hypothetical protein